MSSKNGSDIFHREVLRAMRGGEWRSRGRMGRRGGGGWRRRRRRRMGK
jgi:hypothetical protein